MKDKSGSKCKLDKWVFYERDEEWFFKERRETERQKENYIKRRKENERDP